MVEDLSRLFVAVPLPDDTRHALAASVREAAPGGLPGRPVAPPNWHVTLRFLGDVGAVAADRVAASLDECDLGDTFGLTWGGLGAFPRPQRAAVLWVGADRGAAGLAGLAATVEEAVGAAGLPPEDRPFRPHLTLSRIRPPRDVNLLLESTPRFAVQMEVERVVLYRSHLGRGGARYEEMEGFSLG